MDNDTLPQYIQIALSIARRIAGGDVPEGAVRPDRVLSKVEI